MMGFGELAQQTALYPQEALALVKTSQQSLLIGLPKEISLQENRIALTPEAVAILVRNGHQVVVEKGAGEGSQFLDNEYSEAGAQVVYSPQEVFASDLILKIEPIVEQEFSYLKNGQTIISALNLPTRERSYFEHLNDKHITAVSYEYIEDPAGGQPVIRSLSEIAGSTVMLIAAEYLSSANKGQGII